MTRTLRLATRIALLVCGALTTPAIYAEDAVDPCCGRDVESAQRYKHALEHARGRSHALAAAPEGRVDLARSVLGELNVGYGDERGLRAALAGLDVDILRELPSFGLLTLRVQDERHLDATMAALRALPSVRFVEANYVARTSSIPDDPFYCAQGALQRAGLEDAWRSTRGEQTRVALLDTGVDRRHPDLQGRLGVGFDFVNGRSSVTDDHGHGTAMAGIIAATADNAIGVTGVAPESTLLPVKVADRDGYASVADVAAGIQFAIQNGAHIVNLSLGTRINSQTLELAVSAALQADILVVAAAGNAAVHNATRPASLAGVLAVAPLSSGGELGFSGVLSRDVDIGAPGEELPTTLPGGVYGYVSGSSVAAAFTSGVAALLRSLSPALRGASLSRALRGAQGSIRALESARHVYRFGALDAARATRRADVDLRDLAIVDLEVLPATPTLNQPTVVRVRVANTGQIPVDGLSLQLSTLDPSGAGVIGSIALGVLPVDGERLYTLPWTPAVIGAVRVSAAITPASGRPQDDDPANDHLHRATRVVASPTSETRIRSRALLAADFRSGALRFEVIVENRGSHATQDRVLTATLQGRVIASIPSGVIPPGRGRRYLIDAVLSRPTVNPIARFTAALAPQPGELFLTDNACVYDLAIARSDRLEVLYQQSNGIDVIPDAPSQIIPGRDLVPVQLYVPSKGDAGQGGQLIVDELAIEVTDDAAGAGRRLVYRDGRSASNVTKASGSELIDELGQAVVSGRLFDGQALTANGRHAIIRIPRAEFGVANQPAASVDRFVDVSCRWSYERVILWIFTTTRSGAHRKVMKVRFLEEALPTLPGQNHYYDVHHHTIAEWDFSNPLNLFAPRKAYGGPIQMIKETAFALGLTSSVDDVYGRVITTDHNCFYNDSIPDPDGPAQRPVYGPTSSQAQPGSSEFEAMRALFGPAAGEEVAFKQDVPIPSVNAAIDVLAGLLPGLPLGGHMLLYNNEHVEGPWHGGGFLGGPSLEVPLLPLLESSAKQSQGQNGRSFAYAAHPFGGQGWSDDHLERVLGLKPALRTKDLLHDADQRFVFKGVQFFNGASRRSLSSSKIDFKDLNPWLDADFAKGRATWDSGLAKGFVRWHELLAQLLDYRFVSEPDTVFMRKLYAAAGSDAHGDFNFSTSRLATPLSFSATYNVNDTHLFDAMTYVLADGKAGARAIDRYMAAYADGNSVMTDGPLLIVHMDANTRWDAGSLSWHDDVTRAEDADGQLGGDGALDGGRTMLVRRGSEDLAFAYRYEGNKGLGTGSGELRSIHIYKTESSSPNPSVNAQGRLQLQPVGRLAPKGEGARHEEPLEASEEGPISSNGLYSFAGFTGGDPTTAALAVEDRRCYTNPIWAAPYDLQVDAQPDPVAGVIPSGALRVTFDFDISMSTLQALSFELKALDAKGRSSDALTPGLTLLEPLTGTGWSTARGRRGSRLELTNRDPIALSGAEYPASGRVSFVIYCRDPLRDAAGNALNGVAERFETGRLGTGATTVPGLTAGATVAPSSGSGGGSGGGLGCQVTARGGPSGFTLGPLLLLCLLACLGRRGRRTSAPLVV